MTNSVTVPAVDRSTSGTSAGVTYLSGAPRISTDPHVETPGPRAHVVGIIEGFRNLGWRVDSFIAGDRLPKSWSASGSEAAFTSGQLRRIAVDIVRIILGFWGRRAAIKLDDGDGVRWTYERASLFQALGRPLQKRGRPWILETNQLLYREARDDRSALALSRLARHIELRAYRQADVVICVSEALKELVVGEAGISTDKVLVIPNGVDTTLFRPRVTARCDSELVVGFVGNVVNWHALDMLLREVATMRSQGAFLRVRIVGDGPERPALERLASELGIADAVDFLGLVARDAVPALIAQFDIGFCGYKAPSIGKLYGSPLKIYEYMAMGKPVLSSRSEDATRVLVHGETGFLFDADQPEGLAAGLAAAFASRGRLPDMGARAALEINARHSWQARVLQTIDGVRGILEGKTDAC